VKISIVIPCYNEEETFQEILTKVSQTLEGIDSEIIVVDDGSQDSTPDIIKDNIQLIAKHITHEKNKGKGASIATGFNVATGDILIIQDADLEYDPADYHKLIAPIQNGEADVVYGSRFINPESHRVLYFGHLLGNKFLTFLSNLFTNLSLTDMETCYKALSRDVYTRITLKEKRFGVEPEITAKISRLKCRVFEVPISYHGRSFEEGKKITWKDGISAIWCIVKYNLFRL